MNLNDPGLWTVPILLVKTGPEQVERENFPSNAYGRSLSNK